MPFTDKDEADLKAIVKQKKDSPIWSFMKDSAEYKRQFGGERGGGAEAGELHKGDKTRNPDAYKRGGRVKKFAKGGKIDGIAQRGKTRGKMV